jgi:GT2 family glycosyltransferase
LTRAKQSSEIKAIEILQNILLPALEMSGAEALYIRLNEHAQYVYENKLLTLGPGGKADFTTYFNQFSVTKWKKYTSISNVELCIEFQGDALLTLVINHHQTAEKILLQEQISSGSMDVHRICLPELSQLPDGLLSIRFHTMTEINLKSGSFITMQSPSNDIRLGIVITAFKRDQYVIPAIERLTKELLTNSEYADKLRLTVVDNGGTLQDKPLSAHCHLIQNKNLGGSGGFARGLLHYQTQDSGITHCLFMDDDASCDSEAIKRTIAFLSFSTSSRTAIAGAMMLADDPTIQHENGAIFDQHCIPLKHGLNLKYVRNLTKNDKIELVMYGAWWFFAFPIKHVEHYPFPFFVRGDDVAFSCANPFEITTLNGISSLQESFAAKESPMTVYLDTRQNVIQYLLFQNPKFLKFKILIKFWRTLLKFNCSYHYATAEAACIALGDALKPASFWKDNVDMVEKRQTLAFLLAKETPKPEVAAGNMENLKKNELLLLKLLRWSTLNGHLIPTFLMRRSTTLEKGSAPSLRRVFFAREVLVYDSSNKSGFSLRHNKMDFFSNLLTAFRVSMQVMNPALQLQDKRTGLYENMTREFWEDEFFSIEGSKSKV